MHQKRGKNWANVVAETFKCAGHSRGETGNLEKVRGHVLSYEKSDYGP